MEPRLGAKSLLFWVSAFIPALFSLSLAPYTVSFLHSRRASLRYVTDELRGHCPGRYEMQV